MAAVATMERNGTPIDVDLLDKIRDRWDDIKDELIREIDAHYGVSDGRTFKHARFEALLVKLGIPWPRLPSGKLDTKTDTFRGQAKAHLAIAPLAELRASLAELRHDKARGRGRRPQPHNVVGLPVGHWTQSAG